MEAVTLPFFLAWIYHCGFSASNPGHCFIWIENEQGCILVVVPRVLVYFSNWMVLVLHNVPKERWDASLSSRVSPTAEVELRIHSPSKSPLTFLKEAYSQIS